MNVHLYNEEIKKYFETKPVIKFPYEGELFGNPFKIELETDGDRERLMIIGPKRSREIKGTIGQARKHLEEMDFLMVKTLRIVVVDLPREERKKKEVAKEEIQARQREMLGDDFSEMEKDLIVTNISKWRGYGRSHWGDFGVSVISQIGRRKLMDDQTLAEWIFELRDGKGLFSRVLPRRYNREMYLSRAAVKLASENCGEELTEFVEAIKDILRDNGVPEHHDGGLVGLCTRLTYACDIYLDTRDKLIAEITQADQRIKDLTTESDVPLDEYDPSSEANEISEDTIVEEQEEEDENEVLDSLDVSQLFHGAARVNMG